MNKIIHNIGFLCLMSLGALNVANAAATTSTTIANTMAGAVPQTMQQGAGGMLAKTGEVVAGQAGNTANLAGQQVGQTLAQTASDKIGIVGGITDATGKTLAQTASAGTVGAGNAGSGFFSKLMADMTPKDWIIAGGTAVATGAKAVSANQANATAQQKYEYERALKKQQIANLNDVPTLSNGTLANSGLLNVKKDLSVAV
jgi:hypothetical protein